MICFLSSCNYTNDVNEIHKIFIEWGIEFMGNNNQLHHFTDYLSVVFNSLFIFLFRFYYAIFSSNLPNKLDLKNISVEKLSICPQCLHFFESAWHIFSVCSTSRFIAIFGASVGSPGSARAVEKPWRALRCSSRSVSGGSDDVTAHHIWTCHRSNSPSPSAHMNVTRKQSDWGQMAAVSHSKNAFFL